MNKNVIENNEKSRDLKQAFRELEQARYQQLNTKKSIKKVQKIKNRNKINSTLNANKMVYTRTLLESINNKGISVIIIGLLAISLVMISTGYIFATTDVDKDTNQNKPVVEFEQNADELDVLNIISNNISVTMKKELVVGEREVDFEIIKEDNPDLPKGEEVIIKEGIKGKEEVTYIRTYENNNLISEVETGIEPLEPIVDQVVQVGTSEFLANHKVHLEDTMYVTENVELKEKNDKTSQTVCIIDQSLDVKLLELSGEWCKVSYNDTNIGYVKASSLASEYTIPDIVEKCRVKRILKTVDKDMKLNKPSGLNLSDFKKILTDTKDKKNIFIDNAEVFFKLEEKYNINGVFVAAIGIHESNWGTSTIATDKNNLFGYGSYDRGPYENSLTFETYEEGIDIVAKNLVKNYLNESGTQIYDNNIATGKFYNGATVSGVNKRYASDENWNTKVFKIMENLYGKLQN